MHLSNVRPMMGFKSFACARILIAGSRSVLFAGILSRRRRRGLIAPLVLLRQNHNRRARLGQPRAYAICSSSNLDLFIASPSRHSALPESNRTSSFEKSRIRGRGHFRA
jgi:hypothetical protein